MNNLYSQKQFAILFKSMASRRLRVKIDLLNVDDRIIDSFEKITTSGSISLDGNSTYRRTGNITTLLQDELLPKPNNKIWFNRRIRVQVGLEGYDGEVVWYNMGKFAVSDVRASNSSAGRSLEISLLDYMAFLDGTLSANLSHKTELKVENGTIVSEAIRAVVSQLSKVVIDDIAIDGMDLTLPYDLEFEAGSNAYTMVKELTELFMNVEFYFDENGVFRAHEIRNTESDAIAWDFTVDNMDLSIDYNHQIDLSNVKNSMYIWGRMNENTGEQTYWVYRNRWARNNHLDLNSLDDKQKGDICFIRSESKSYCWNGVEWELLDFNVAPDFNIESIGEKVHVYNNEKVFTEEQARLRSEYELTQASNMAETISFSCLPIYILKPNQKIRVDDKVTGIKGDYLIDNISVPLDISSSMSIVAHKLHY